MLHLQHKSNRRRHKLWLKLLACSFGMHAILLILLFVGYQDNIQLIFSMSQQMLPQQTAQVSLVTFSAPRSAARATQQTTARKSVVRKPVVKKPVTKIAAKKPIKKNIQKKVTQAPSKKPAPKKVIAQAKSKPVQQPLAKKVAASPASSAAQLACPSSAHPECREAVYRGIQLSNQDAYMMEQFAVLQQELVKHWQPPIGISSECTCVITAQINNQGKINDITIDDSSGVLMFDIAARTAMLAMELPKWTWGKSLTITFKP